MVAFKRIGRAGRASEGGSCHPYEMGNNQELSFAVQEILMETLASLVPFFSWRNFAQKKDLRTFEY